MNRLLQLLTIQSLTNAEIPVITVLAVHFSVAVLAPFFFKAWGRNAFYALAVVPGAAA
jgi:multicomponent Na+:H+ antiporter subunit A